MNPLHDALVDFHRHAFKVRADSMWADSGGASVSR